jgi:hypothetical protein
MSGMGERCVVDNFEMLIWRDGIDGWAAGYWVDGDVSTLKPSAYKSMCIVEMSETDL